METRSKKRYRNLEEELKDLGLFEEGMEYQEMTDIMKVVKDSKVTAMDTELDEDIEKALRASESDFLPTNDSLHNSTMVSNDMRNSADFVDYPFYREQLSSTPDSFTLTIQAEVHKEMNWSPPTIENDELMDDFKSKSNSICDNEKLPKRTQIDSGIDINSYDLISEL